jgi:trimethylamine--corrinoid protein Co-methyltransferase
MNIEHAIEQAPEGARPALRAEKETYERIHETAKAVLAEVGIATRNPRVIGLLEDTGLAGYDASVGRVYLLPELVDRSLDAAARTFAADEGPNTLGIGGIPPFLYRESDPYPLPATYADLERIIGLVAENLDVVRFLSQPVKVHKGDPLRCNRIMDRLTGCLKVTCSAYMREGEAVRWFSGRDDWHDSICGVKSPLGCMDDMMDALVASARAGNHLRLTTMPLGGRTAPRSPEACIVVTHAEVLFMLAVAQTVRPGMLCMLGGMPCTTKPDGDLAYSHDGMNLLNVAVARLNLWVTGLPSVVSGGSTDSKKPGEQALSDGIRGRQILCGFGVHNARHCFGALDNLNFFSETAFVADCEAQRQYLAGRPPAGLKPLHLPRDDRAFEVIQRVAGGDYHSDGHTTAHLSDFDEWAKAAEALRVPRSLFPVPR